MSYSVGDTVRLRYTLGSTATTAPEAANVHLIVTDPVAGDTRYASSQLTKTTPSSDSTSTGWARWEKLITVPNAGRWLYQFTSTGVLMTSAGGAFAVARPLASTST